MQPLDHGGNLFDAPDEKRVATVGRLGIVGDDADYLEARCPSLVELLDQLGRAVAGADDQDATLRLDVAQVETVPRSDGGQQLVAVGGEAHLHGDQPQRREKRHPQEPAGAHEGRRRCDYERDECSLTGQLEAGRMTCRADRPRCVPLVSQRKHRLTRPFRRSPQVRHPSPVPMPTQHFAFDRAHRLAFRTALGKGAEYRFGHHWYRVVRF